MKSDNLKKLEEETLGSEENKIKDEKISWKIFIRCSIMFLLIVIIGIISIVLNHRIILFSSIVPKAKPVIVFLYYFAVLINIMMLGSIIVVVICSKKSKNSYGKTAYKLYKFFDIPSFMCDCIVILYFILSFIFTPCTVSGDSMNNTLNDKDILLCSDFLYEPKKGDIVVFDSSNYVMSSSGLFIKRVVAIEKDIVSFNEENTVLYVNDVEVAHVTSDQYLNLLNSIDMEEYEDSFTVPNDKLIVLGDNRVISYDSRYFGLIDEKDIIGRVLIRIAPFGKPQTNILE